MSVSPTTAWQSPFTDHKVSLETSLTDSTPSPRLAEKNALSLVSIGEWASLRTPTGGRMPALECVLYEPASVVRSTW